MKKQRIGYPYRHPWLVTFYTLSFFFGLLGVVTFVVGFQVVSSQAEYYRISEALLYGVAITQLFAACGIVVLSGVAAYSLNSGANPASLRWSAIGAYVCAVVLFICESVILTDAFSPEEINGADSNSFSVVLGAIVLYFSIQASKKMLLFQKHPSEVKQLYELEEKLKQVK